MKSPSEMLKAEQARTDLATISHSSSDMASHLQDVIRVISKDLQASDLKWSLFVAASQSYRHDSCLRPFPPMFFVDGKKDLLALAEAVESVPPFLQFESLAHSIPNPAVHLLHWVLVDMKEPFMAVIDKSEMDSILDLVLCELPAPSPSMVVTLHYDPASAIEQRWAEAKKEYGSVYAYHGSKVDNFYSILHHGLQQHLTKNALFGQGVYLSSELLVCLPYSRNGIGWNHSSIGSELSVVALCEIVDHPSVHYQKEDECEDKSRARAQDSMAREVPHKVYVVPNSDLIRVRHLLVYKVQPTPASHHSKHKKDSWLLTWLGQHKMAVSLFAYAVMLISIGLSRSPTLPRFWREICNMLGFHH